jgi:hypothetical protein
MQGIQVRKIDLIKEIKGNIKLRFIKQYFSFIATNTFFWWRKP